MLTLAFSLSSFVLGGAVTLLLIRMMLKSEAFKDAVAEVIEEKKPEIKAFLTARLPEMKAIVAKIEADAK